MRAVICALLILLLTAGALFAVSHMNSPEEEIPPAETVQVTTAPETVPETTEPHREPEVPETEPKRIYGTVPRFYQTDFPYEPFSEGTVIDSGCSITCLAMVASYLTNHEYTPAQLAYHFNIEGLNNVQRLEYGNEQLKLPAVRMDDAQKCYDALKEGKVVIAMVGRASIFTSTAHFIVVTGVTEDGKILVNDPIGSRYDENFYMTTRFRDGFEKYHLFQGFQGAWIYDKKDMPEEPYIYPAELPQQPENRYRGYRLSTEDREMLAAFLWAEAPEESQQVRQAIAEVLLNRVVSHQFPYLVRDVIRKGEYYDRLGLMQRAGELGQEFYDAVDRAMYGPYLLPEDVFIFSRWEKGGRLWGELGPYTFLYSR